MQQDRLEDKDGKKTPKRKIGLLEPYRRRTLVKAIVANKGDVAAGIKAAGVPPNAALEIIKTDAFKDLLSRELDRHDLGLARYLSEVAKGLGEGAIGKHTDYLAAQERLLGLTQEQGTGAPVQVNILIAEMQRRGIDPGPVESKP